MHINKPSGNMYPDCATCNPIGGECLHDCIYCYMKELKEKFPGVQKKYSGKPRLIEKELRGKINNPNNYTLFVQDCSDLFAKNVPKEIIERVLKYCRKFNNKYLYLSKNPGAFKYFLYAFPHNSILGTTVETNRDCYQLSKAPIPYNRLRAMKELNTHSYFNVMLSIEPIIDFDLNIFLGFIKDINPLFVTIGADTKNHNLPEPPPEKVRKLIIKLEEFTEVRKKSNLDRLLKEK